ncbi:MAG: efflux RND transporter periplasmic adaptor subunit [Chloroflexota bacterium]|nr:efflux RND transporter periplasmic adaptor subunit [Ardenticatenaceae bacterium]
MLRKRGFWIVTLILAALIAGASYFYYTSSVAAETVAEEDEVQTSVARLGEIVVSATGAGTVIAASEVELSFASSGQLTELLVQIGDEVKAGDVLARIDDTDAQQSLVNAQLQLAQAAMQTDASATQTGVSFDDISVEEAQINLELAQADLDDLLNWEADPDEIALAEANLAAAEASYNAARGQEAASSTNISVEAISVDQAERNLADAQAAYDTAYDPGRDWELNDSRHADALEAERERADAALLQAQESLQIANLNYSATVSSVNHSSSTSAQSNLLSAQQALVTAQTGPTEEEIEAAQMSVRQAELALQQVKLNQEANVLSLEQAQLTVESAEEAVEQTTLLAPVDGTVTAVNYSVGESASGTVIVLADLEQPVLEVYLDETDMTMVGLGYEVEVVFDALPEETFTGQVVLIDPQLVNESGITAVRALVELNADSFAKPQTLPVGLNATVEVIGGRTENAVLVPVEALREISTGQYAVFVMENGEPKMRLVTVGLMDFTYAEITSGLEVGEEVTTGIVQTQ